MKWYVTLAVFFLYNAVGAQRAFPKAEELGNVRWYRSYDTALQVAKAEDKPVLILFQEVPGCSTCRNYGQKVLSHPLVVEAIETLFVPLAIFNNKPGADRIILDKYQEPSWNNPVVRIVDDSGTDIHPRIARDYSAQALVQAMVSVLQSQGQSIPSYLDIAKQELAATDTDEAIYQMYCFWSGEKVLGAMPGVVDVAAGFVGGAEVVKVTFDPAVTDADAIGKQAKKHRISPIQESGSYRAANKDIHYYLRNSDYRYLPLSKMQQVKVNAAIGAGQDASSLLSPRQLRWYQSINRGTLSKEVRFDQPFESTWWQVVQQTED